MGCLPSKLKFSTSDSASKPVTQKMQPLIRPEHYKDGKRPSFAAAYARAARRYGFETGRNAGFAKRNNMVVKVKSKHDKETAHEVPAESIQNGASSHPVLVHIDALTGVPEPSTRVSILNAIRRHLSILRLAQPRVRCARHDWHPGGHPEPRFRHRFIRPLGLEVRLRAPSAR